MAYPRPRTYTLIVTIPGDNLLDVDDANAKNEIDTDDKLQVIVWRLAPTVPANIKFGFPDRDGVGHIWIPGPKPHQNWFRDAYSMEDGRAIGVKVSHHTGLSNGEWVYMLYAYDVDTGEPYSTIYAPDNRTMTVTNPVIINH
jgi:hypothetical protein